MESVFNSEKYVKIRDSIESTWPEYKIKAANELIISTHGVKLKSRRDEHDKKEVY